MRQRRLDALAAMELAADPIREGKYCDYQETYRRLGADAVVNARYGDARVAALSWGSRRATGQAVKFPTEAEIAARAAAAPAEQ